MTRNKKEGASTITMQLAGNLYLDRRQLTLTRKAREAITAFQIEQTYTKQEIIELYANTVNFGRGSYGLRIAAHQYFDKEPKELTTAECAFLVGLLKKPEYYNKRDNYDDAISRRNLILSLMLQQNYIPANKFMESTREEISFMKSSVSKDKALTERRLKNMGIAPHFVETIRQNLHKDRKLGGYDFYSDGLTIYTTLDSRIQRAISKAVDGYMPEIQKTFNASYS
jgi:penicillin-binding protein 1A